MYWYTIHSVVGDVCLSVGLSVGHDRELCRKAEPIEVPIGVWSHGDTRNHVLDGGLDPPGERAFGGG